MSGEERKMKERKALTSQKMGRMITEERTRKKKTAATHKKNSQIRHFDATRGVQYIKHL